MERCGWGKDLGRVEEDYVLGSQRERDRGGEEGLIGWAVSLMTNWWMHAGIKEIETFQCNDINAIITFEDDNSRLSSLCFPLQFARDGRKRDSS